MAVTVTFTSSGTWTCPAGVTVANIQCWGSGGGGGNLVSTSGGSGGGGGEFAQEATNTVVPGTVYTITVGTVGAGSTGSNGGNGGNTSFSGTGATTVTAHGGGGGNDSSSTGGTAGTGSTNSVHHDGGAGGGSASKSDGGGGGGGSGGTGSAGNTGGTANSSSAGTGATAVTGGGPGGAGSNNTSGNGHAPVSGPGGGGGADGNGSAGGPGFAGQVTITYTVNAGGNDPVQILPGPTWLDLFKPGMPKPKPPVPPSFINMVTTSGSVAMAPMATSGSVQASAPPMDLPAIRPGPAWLSQFKPGWRPHRPPVAEPASGPNQANQPNLSDIPEIQPGPGWMRQFKPGLAKPRPVPPADSKVANPGVVAMAPMGLGGTATVYPTSSGGLNAAPMGIAGTGQVPIIGSGSVAMAPMKESGHLNVPVIGSGSVAMAPMAVVTPPVNRDLPEIKPGPTWIDRFKPGLAKTLKITAAQQYIGSRGTMAMAPMAVAVPVVQYLPFPQFPLNLRYELLINGTWLDITGYVYQRDNAVITRGLPNETQSVTPAQMTLTLDNRTGRFSPNNPLGAYFPYLTRNVQMRVSVVNQASATGSPYSGYRFWGEVSTWPPRWDPTGADVYCQVTVSGVLRRYVQGAALGSTLRQYYTALTGDFAPYGYWPCEDGSKATEIASALADVPSATFTGAPGFASDASFGGSDPIPTVSSSIWHGLTLAAANPPGTGSITENFAGTYTWTAPPGVTAVTSVSAMGGGGGGGDQNTTIGGGGGGGGGIGKAASVSVTAGTKYTYVVGAGGAAGALGGGVAGHDSTFTGDSQTVTGHAGAGGSFGGAGGVGGAGATFNGGKGGAGQTSSTSFNQRSLYGNTGATGGGNASTDAGQVSTSWTCPPGTTSVDVTAGGGGGGGQGGGAFGGGYGGGAGGGGGYASGGGMTVTPGSSYTFNAGNGGPGGTNGSDGANGSDSSFSDDSGGQVTAGGGQGGNANGLGGSGGSASGANGGFAIGGTGGAAGAILSGGVPGGGGGGSGGGQANGAGGNASGRHPGAGGGNGSGGGWGASSVNGSGSSTGGTGIAGGGSAGGGGGGGGGAKSSTTGQNGGGGGGGWISWNWAETGVPTAGGGGSSAGSVTGGNAGSTSGVGGSAPSGGGAGGNAGLAGSSPGGGGGGATPAIGTESATAAGAGAPGQVSFAWSGGVTSPVAGDIIRFALHVNSAGAADGAVLLRAVTYGGIARLDVVYHLGGHLELIGYNASSAQVFDSGSVAFSADGTPLYVSVEIGAAGAAATWKLTAIQPGAASVAATASGSVAATSVGFVSDVYVDPAGTVVDSGTAIGQITVQTYADTLVNLSPIVNGYAGEYAADRISRLCAAQGIGFELVGTDTDTPKMGPQQDDTFVNILQSCADLDRGQLFETRDQLGIGYRTRVDLQGNSPDLLADYTAGVLSGSLQPTADDQFTRNDITVSRNGGASSKAQLTSGAMSILSPPLGVGDYTYSLTVQAYSDNQLTNLVAWMLTVGTVDEYRYPTIEFDLCRAEVETLFSTIPALDVGDFVQVINPPSFLQAAPISLLAWGFTETLNAYTWTISINAVPEDPYSEGNPPTW